ncbi:hypothetical protein IWQ57_005845, partial [Coemansia nantahalensis]
QRRRRGAGWSRAAATRGCGALRSLGSPRSSRAACGSCCRASTRARPRLTSGRRTAAHGPGAAPQR